MQLRPTGTSARFRLAPSCAYRPWRNPTHQLFPRSIVIPIPLFLRNKLLNRHDRLPHPPLGKPQLFLLLFRPFRLFREMREPFFRISLQSHQPCRPSSRHATGGGSAIFGRLCISGKLGPLRRGSCRRRLALRCRRPVARGGAATS